MDVSWEMEENSVITVIDFYLRRDPSCMVEAHSKNVASRKNFLWPNLVWRWSIRNVVQLLCLQFTISPLWIWRFIPPSRTSLKRLKAGWKVWKCSWLLVITIKCESVFWNTGMDANLRYCHPSCSLLPPCRGRFDGKCKGRLGQRTTHGENQKP